MPNTNQAADRTFQRGQRVKFIAGPFQGKRGKVQIVGDTGRVLVKINAKGMGCTFAEPTEIAVVLHSGY